MKTSFTLKIQAREKSVAAGTGGDGVWRQHHDSLREPCTVVSLSGSESRGRRKLRKLGPSSVPESAQ